MLAAALSHQGPDFACLLGLGSLYEVLVLSARRFTISFYRMSLDFTKFHKLARHEPAKWDSLGS